MNMKISWDDHRYFLAIARAGSHTAAAKALKVSQPTVSRRLEALERKLNATLFKRTRNGYELTPTGTELFETVARVEEELLEANRNIFGRDQQLSGSLKFTTTEIFLNGYLGPHLWKFLRQHDSIELQLVCTQTVLSINRHEADVAIRFTEQPPDTLVGRRLGTLAYGIYAATDHAEKIKAMERESWDWIGMHDETYNRMLYGTFLPSTRPKHRVDSMAAMHGMVRAGLGVSILPCYTADLDSDLVRLDEKPFLDPKFSIWVLYHPDARRTQRLRLFVDFLVSCIRSDKDLFEGQRPLAL